MKILFDTNVVLDVLARREPFFEQSQAVIRLVAEGGVHGAVTANTITDIFFLLRKQLSKDKAKTALHGLMELLEVADVTGDDCLAALELEMDDYEDALLACCAQRWEADCIVTRNTKDFFHSPVKALAPDVFVNSL
jgi:predicted nucleic acid-binding protein